jgi:hypothetical protein
MALLCLLFATARVIMCAVQMADQVPWCSFLNRFTVFFNLLKTKRRLLYLNTQFVPLLDPKGDGGLGT